MKMDDAQYYWNNFEEHIVIDYHLNCIYTGVICIRQVQLWLQMTVCSLAKDAGVKNNVERLIWLTSPSYIG